MPLRAAPSDRGPPGPVVPPAVLERLNARADPDGFLPFERFMDVALYAAEVGYYARARSPFGPEGDFYTASRIPLFARTLARRVAEVREALGRPAPFHLVDLGCGDGTLVAQIVRALSERFATSGVEAVVIDRVPARRSAGLEALAPFAQGAGVAGRAAGSLAELGPIRGVVLAHELLDALPTRRWTWDGSAWKESGFRLAGNRLVPAVRPLGAPSVAPGLPSPLPEEAGTVLEISPGAAAVVREVADHLVEGLLVVVDFGDEGRALRAAHPLGTLAAVRAHRAVRSPEESPGEVDLSVFVDFTAVRSAAASAGLVELAYRSQAESLAAWGIEAELERALEAARTEESKVRTRLAAKNLLFGFENFRVLELSAAASAGRLAALSGASPAVASR